MLGSESRFVERIVLGMWQANCYIVGDEELGRAFVVDPGQDVGGTVQTRLERRGVTCEAILLTHGHLDHLWGVPELVADLDVPVRLHADDRYLWDDPGAAFAGDTAAMAAQLGIDWQPPTDHLETFTDAAEMTLAGMALQARHTPGHTPGSSVFLLTDVGADEPFCIAGDLIFAGSVGRTDFPRGSYVTQMASLQRVILPLDDATVIVPGHGPETTVGKERVANPFLQEIVKA